MAWQWSTVGAFNIASGLLFVTLGALVLRVRDRHPVNPWLAAFCIFFGLSWIAEYWYYIFPGNGVEKAGQFVLDATLSIAGIALLGVAALFPRTLEGARTRVAIVAIITAPLAIEFTLIPAWNGIGVEDAGAVGRLIGFSALLAASVAFALKGRHPALGPDERRQVDLVAAAVLVYPSVIWGGLTADLAADWGGFNVPQLTPLYVAGTFTFLAPAILWLRNASLGSRPERRRARSIAWLTLTAMLLNMIIYVAASQDAANTWTTGAARVVTVALLVYAIMRHQLLGIDVRVRWGLSKTTVAAIFVSVFFIVSEAAQEFFGQETGNQYYGIAAAGLLVLGIAPLQRMADRLAEKAVPFDARTTQMQERDTIYVAALHAAMRDGKVTRREEGHLAEVAEGLRIGPKRALELRDQVQAEARSAGQS